MDTRKTVSKNKLIYTLRLGRNIAFKETKVDTGNGGILWN